MKASVIAVGCAMCAWSMFGVTGGAIAEEETVSLDQVPAAVKTAIEKEVEGGKIIEIEKEEEDGKTVYEVEFEDDGETEEAAFTEDGKQVGGDDDDGEDDDKDGDKDDNDQDEDQDEDDDDKT